MALPVKKEEKFQITMTKIQNSKSVFVIEYWNFGFNWNLVLGI